MRIFDMETRQEVFNPDLTIGAIMGETDWIVATDGTPDGDVWERVEMYHVWTPEEITQREAGEAQAARQAVINAMPETLDAYATETDAALFDLDAAQATYETDTDAALFDLAEYVASLEARIQALEV